MHKTQNDYLANLTYDERELFEDYFLESQTLDPERQNDLCEKLKVSPYKIRAWWKIRQDNYVESVPIFRVGIYRNVDEKAVAQKLFELENAKYLAERKIRRKAELEKQEEDEERRKAGEVSEVMCGYGQNGENSELENGAEHFRVKLNPEVEPFNYPTRDEFMRGLVCGGQVPSNQPLEIEESSTSSTPKRRHSTVEFNREFPIRLFPKRQFPKRQFPRQQFSLLQMAQEQLRGVQTSRGQLPVEQPSRSHVGHSTGGHVLRRKIRRNPSGGQSARAQLPRVHLTPQEPMTQDQIEVPQYQSGYHPRIQIPPSQCQSGYIPAQQLAICQHRSGQLQSRGQIQRRQLPSDQLVPYQVSAGQFPDGHQFVYERIIPNGQITGLHYQRLSQEPLHSRQTPAGALIPAAYSSHYSGNCSSGQLIRTSYPSVEYPLPQYPAVHSHAQYGSQLHSAVPYSRAPYYVAQVPAGYIPTSTQYSAVQYSPAQYSTGQYPTEQFSTAQYPTVQYPASQQFIEEQQFYDDTYQDEQYSTGEYTSVQFPASQEYIEEQLFCDGTCQDEQYSESPDVYEQHLDQQNGQSHAQRYHAQRHNQQG